MSCTLKISIYVFVQNGTTALMVASQYGRPSMVSELLAHGSDPSAEDNDGWTALLLAAKHGRTNICSDLLDHGANIQQREMVHFQFIIKTLLCSSIPLYLWKLKGLTIVTFLYLVHYLK